MLITLHTRQGGSNKFMHTLATLKCSPATLHLHPMHTVTSALYSNAQQRHCIPIPRTLSEMCYTYKFTCNTTSPSLAPCPKRALLECSAATLHLHPTHTLSEMCYTYKFTCNTTSPSHTPYQKCATHKAHLQHHVSIPCTQSRAR